MITATIILSGLDKDVYQGDLTTLPTMSPSRHFLISLSAGMSYTVLTYCTLSISGGHLNPAITFARCVMGRFRVSKGLLYVFAQFLGAMFGAGMTRMCVPVCPTPPYGPPSWLTFISSREFLTCLPTLGVPSMAPTPRTGTWGQAPPSVWKCW